MMKHLTDAQIEELKNSLLEEKSELERHFNTEDQTADGQPESERDSTGELSAVDNHPADLGTETFERGRDLAIDDQMSETLEQVNAALQRIEEGTYGVSEVSGKEIPFERLQALPFTTYLVDESPQQNQVNDYRPVEEDLITPAAKGSGENRQHNTGRFDDAGAWQAVEDYGVADSPAMSAQREVHDYNELAEGSGDNENFTESIETFAANDIDGDNRHVEQGNAVKAYEDRGEGDTELQIDEEDQEVDAEVKEADRRR
ncbi:conjugal transfer protein TraR [Paenibacillus sp. WLX1005]|uniref:conjugal transfer protein TraR n=1 Tax=Paenibacillus sp. WLX1005 TaxID=3243766 RepID=UPI0039842F18